MVGCGGAPGPHRTRIMRWRLSRAESRWRRQGCQGSLEGCLIQRSKVITAPVTGAADRRQALREAWRVLRPGGRLLAMGISRFASLLDGLYEGWLDDPQFRPIVDRDLADGQHRNPDPV